jgi:hypothetical protein
LGVLQEHILSRIFPLQSRSGHFLGQVVKIGNDIISVFTRLFESSWSGVVPYGAYTLTGVKRSRSFGVERHHLEGLGRPPLETPKWHHSKGL